MALDPIVKGFLDQLALQAPPEPKPLDVAEQRATMTGLMQAVGPRDVAIGKVTDFSCAGPAGDIRLRSYVPVAASAAALPTLVYFHGGGFVVGDLVTHDGLCRLIANEASVRVIAVDYRLAPEHPFPAAYDDAVAALRFIADNAAELGVDATRLAVGGDSAGGALAAEVAQHARDAGGLGLAFQLLLFPVTQVGAETPSLRANATGYLLERVWLEWCYAQYAPPGTDTKDVRLSPLHAESLAGLPPAYVMLAGYDPLHDEGAEYAKRLRDSGVAVQVADYPDLVHVFIYLTAILPQATVALKDAAAALRSALKAG